MTLEEFNAEMLVRGFTRQLVTVYDYRWMRVGYTKMHTVGSCDGKFVIWSFGTPYGLIDVFDVQEASDWITEFDRRYHGST